EAELEANRRLAADDPVKIFETTLDEAKSLGAVGLFGEKYGDLVRVVEIGDYSRELCGGTHVHRTGSVAVIRLLREGSIGAGMRRVEALVGPDALREINAERALLRGLVEALEAKDPQGAIERARRVLEENKRLRNELGSVRAGDRGITAPAWWEPAARAIGGGAGGKDHLANAGGKDAAKVPEALGTIPSRVRELLDGR